jgi:hypothetical protein
MTLSYKAHVVVHIAKLLPFVYGFVAVIDGSSAVTEGPVLAAVGERGDASGYAVAKRRCCGGYGLDREVLRVSGVIAAVQRQDGVRENKEKSERDKSRDDEGLFAVSVSRLGIFVDAVRDAAQSRMPKIVGMQRARSEE